MTAVGVLLYPGCTIAEILPATTLLAGRGVQVVHVASDAASMRDESGLLVAPDVALADVDPTALAAIVVPGGDPGSVIDNEDVLGLLRASGDAGAVMAGICAGVVVLARAGLAVERRITHNYRAPWAPPEIEEHVAALWHGATVEPDASVGVVVDGRLITALPNAGAEFAVRIGHAVGAVEAKRSAALIRHLRGEFVTELFD